MAGLREVQLQDMRHTQFWLDPDLGRSTLVCLLLHQNRPPAHPCFNHACGSFNLPYFISRLFQEPQCSHFLDVDFHDPIFLDAFSSCELIVELSTAAPRRRYVALTTSTPTTPTPRLLDRV